MFCLSSITKLRRSLLSRLLTEKLRAHELCKNQTCMSIVGAWRKKETSSLLAPFKSIAFMWLHGGHSADKSVFKWRYGGDVGLTAALLMWQAYLPGMGPLQLSDHVVQNRQTGEQMTHWAMLNKENSNLVVLFNTSQCVICSPVWRFCTTWSRSCKGPLKSILRSSFFPFRKPV